MQAIYTNMVYTGFITKYNSITLSGVVDVGSISFLHRKNGVDFYASAGAGVDLYKPQYIYVYNNDGATGTKTGCCVKTFTRAIKELAGVVGVGAKFHLTDALSPKYWVTPQLLLTAITFSGYNTAPG